MIGSDDAAAILARLAVCGIEVWVDGGWGVDALLGEQTRVHDDLDLAIARACCSAAREGLAPLGFEHAVDIEPGLPARLALRDLGDRRVDFHPIAFDESGNGWQELPDGSWGRYSAAGLAGVGTIAQRRVRCLTLSCRSAITSATSQTPRITTTCTGSLSASDSNCRPPTTSCDLQRWVPRFSQLAGQDEDRLSDLNEAFRDPGIRAVSGTVDLEPNARPSRPTNDRSSKRLAEPSVSTGW